MLGFLFQGVRAMRAFAAITVAVMSVTTGGPLRCPCQLAALFRIETRLGLATRSTPDLPKGRCCPCESHADPGLPWPVEPKPSPHFPPCKHHLVIDLAVPHMDAGRVLDDRDSGDPTAVPVRDCGGAFPENVTAAALLSSGGRPLPPHDRLRYCHAFRC